MISHRLDFRSDNVGMAHPAILDAIARVNEGPATPYGGDDTSTTLNARFSDLFEAPVKVFPISSGTASNALALSALTPPYGAIICHSAAHIHTAEAGATELLTGGAKLDAVPGERGRLSPKSVQDAILSRASLATNFSPPAAISVSQLAESGTAYQLDELAEIGAIAREHGLKFHMDGARFANALATLRCSPAEMTSRIGLDVLSFGCTKNGGLSHDAIVVFNPEIVRDLSYRIRRTGHTASKMRFASAQLLAYVEDDLYLKNARRANELATRLADELSAVEGVQILHPVEGNQMFARLPGHVKDRLRRESVLFLDREEEQVRLVCRFDGTDDAITDLIAIARSA